MKRTVQLVMALVTLGLLLAACTGGSDSLAPTVTLTTPTDGAIATTGVVVDLEGTASDNVAVTRVEIRIDGEVLNRTVPEAGAWSYGWTPAAEGSYEVSARAYDAAGNFTDTDAATVTVTDAEVAATSGGVSGTLTRVAPVATIDGASLATPEAAPVVPGEVFVVFKQGRPEPRLGTTSTLGAFSFAADGGFAFDGTAFEQVRAYPADTGLALYRSSGLTAGATHDLVAELRNSDAVAEAFPNWILRANAVPDDGPYYDYQAWHYNQMNLEAAWDIETGASDRVTVAVLDTGRYDHSDLQWAVGANFVNWNYATYTPAPAEGDITNSMTNPGGSPHGTHVAGTIGATTNNGIGVAGVNWNVDILPVKVLGADGSGSLAGILEGVFWAAGYPDEVYGDHVNQNPARVINMSLGGALFEACPASIDGVFADFASIGTYSVVSAGNDGSPADIYFPANCPSVITVGATGPTGARAYYSNYGPFVDVMAPGGDADYDHPVDPAFAATVLSTGVSEGAESYLFMQGTSMAAPHVTGLVSLMLAREPDLTLEEVRTRLHDASVPLSYAECNVPAVGMEGQNVCGAGLLDAEAALLGATLTTPTAHVYALPYDGTDAPILGLGNLSSLAEFAPYRTEAVAQPNGDFTFSFEGMEPGLYRVVGLELRDAENGISNVDRVGFVDEVEVVAGDIEPVTVVVDPIYSTMR